MSAAVSFSLASADLHLHSTASDGRDTPGDLIKKAHGFGVLTVALTDHDTLAGLKEAEQACGKLGMRFIPGVELSAEGESQVHLLAYGVTDQMAGIRQLIAQMRKDRDRRQGLYLQKLRDLGLPLEEDDLALPPGTAFSRPLLARALVKKGYAPSEPDAFHRLLSPGRPAYVPRLHVSAREVIDAIVSDGAVCVLAHPGLLPCHVKALENKLLEWVDAGLEGLEVHHPAHDDKMRVYLWHFAREHGLLITSGSDYHGKLARHHGDIGSQFEHWTTADADLPALLAKLDR